ncbi:hypothetical protein KDX31_17450 [Amphritea atlantica]|uniref:Uncharacterized protein n=1 Tax=Amphritea atlantica TaxID=355243 RepID=A0ABY5GTI7_9GAMM|nr:hypothetical protein KDX31_17450 [Amphritea atlantica]
MNYELEKLIVKRFPFMDRKCYPNTDFGYGGFDIPDGWFPLIVQFAKELDEIKPSDLVLFQVKEKFNQLIICAECSGPEKDLLALDALEENIEKLSFSLCGGCGEFLMPSHVCHPRSQNEDALIEWAALYLEDTNIA